LADLVRGILLSQNCSYNFLSLCPSKLITHWLCSHLRTMASNASVAPRHQSVLLLRISGAWALPYPCKLFVGCCHPCASRAAKPDALWRCLNLRTCNENAPVTQICCCSAVVLQQLWIGCCSQGAYLRPTAGRAPSPPKAGSAGCRSTSQWVVELSSRATGQGYSLWVAEQGKPQNIRLGHDGGPCYLHEQQTAVMSTRNAKK
jgi:hypothetical protein